MKVSDFDFDLPKEKIAVRPAEPRDSAKMLCVKGSLLEDKIFSDIIDEFEAGDCLVLNDTKVIPVRIKGKRDEVKIEATLHKMYDESSWWAFAKPGKRLKIGQIVNFDKKSLSPCGRVQEDEDTCVEVRLGEGEKEIDFKRREYKEELKELSRKLRKDSTLQEGILWQILKNSQTGYKFRRQFNIDNKYIVDFVCLEKRLIVEADGGQHCESKEDKVRDEYLESNGFKILRLWNNDILDNLEGVYDRIIQQLDNSPSPKSEISTLPRGESDCTEQSIKFNSSFYATVMQKDEHNGVLFKFNKSGEELMSALENNGVMPLPPYIERLNGSDDQDASDYQTVFAKNSGAVAAPTAGLHFTEELLEKIKAKGVKIVYVTLHVGAGTFMPVKVENTEDHVMHSEYGVITQEQADELNKVHEEGGDLIAVGTTSMRLLESATGEDGIVRPFAQETDIFITPGYTFRAVDRMITNFHLPKSTLFMLVCAFAGTENMKKAYEHAIDGDYRFYSYGDACLLEKSF